MNEKLWTPAAVLAGFALLSVVTWRGLARLEGQSEAPAQPTSPALPAGALGPSPTPQPPQTRPAAPPRAVDPEVLRTDAALRLRDLVQEQLVAQKPGYRACWTPELARLGPPRDHDVTIAFDAKGHETKREFQGVGLPVPELTACLKGKKVEPLQVAPPGEPTTVVVRLTLP